MGAPTYRGSTNPSIVPKRSKFRWGTQPVTDARRAPKLIPTLSRTGKLSRDQHREPGKASVP